jgi:cytoskeletal protein RodZ
MSDRLWPIHFKAIPTPKPRTPKQNAQEAQTPTEAPATTATTTAATTAATTATTTAATTTTTTAATTVTKTTTKKVKGKAKGRRALPLERWHKRLGHLNYADVKQLATHSSQIKLANNKELFCELCAYGKQHAISNYKP